MYCADIRYILFSISILNDYEMFYAKLKSKRAEGKNGKIVGANVPETRQYCGVTT